MEKYEIRDVIGYEGLYEVDTNGDVWSLNYNHTDERQKLRAGVASNGYLTVALPKNGKQKTYYVHRLVAEAFIDNPMNLPQVNHKDENKQNNSVENLEWCTAAYNLEYSGIHIKAGEAAAKACSKPILQFTLDGEFVKEYPSLIEASRQTGIHQGNISCCCNGKRNHACGYKWKYKKC